MPQLVPPRALVVDSFVRATFASGGEEHPDYGLAAAERARQDPQAYVDRLVGDAQEDAPRPDGWVPSTHLWWVEGGTYLGRLQIRHRLTDWLREQGGHIGYSVVPEHRRQGHAGAMLLASLPIAARLGIECALLTCDNDNEPSRRIIERAGGLLQDRRGDKLRYWVPTS